MKKKLFVITEPAKNQREFLWSGREHATGRQRPGAGAAGCHDARPADGRRRHIHRWFHRRLPRHFQRSSEKGQPLNFFFFNSYFIAIASTVKYLAFVPISKWGPP